MKSFLTEILTQERKGADWISDKKGHFNAEAQRRGGAERKRGFLRILLFKKRRDSLEKKKSLSLSAPLRLCASALKCPFLSEIQFAPLRLNWFGKLAFFLLLLLSPALHAATPQEEAKQAFLLYREGEAAVEPKQRREAFNGALKLYSHLSENSCSGTVLYNLANSYFQLGEYPWAILYYERAARILPREGLIPLNLAIAQGKLGITALDGPSWIALSLKERWELISFFVIALYVALSAFLFFRWKFLRRISYALSALLLITLLSIGWSWYVEPLRAVVVENNPTFPAGTTVKVIREQEGFVEVKSGEKKGVLTSQQLRLVL